MADLLSRKTLILAAVEAAYGTPETLVGADAILCSNAELTPIAGGTTSRDFYRDYLGASPEIHIKSHVMLAFDVELAGSGTAGTPPGWGTLLRGCGFDETINGIIDVTYDLLSTGFEGLTIECYIDGQRHRLFGCRGNAVLNYAAGEIPKIRFTFTGLWVDPATAPPPVADFSAFKAPIPGSNVNTPTFTLHSTSTYRLYNLSIDLGNAVSHVDIVNEETILLTDRNVRGSITLAAEALSTFNPFTIAKANTLGNFVLQHGTAAGYINTINGPKVQLLEPTYGDQDGRRTISANIVFTPDSGNDEIQLVLT